MSATRLSGTKRKRKTGLVDLGEGVIIEILDAIKETSDSEELAVYLEILSKLEADIETLKKTQAGFRLRQLRKSNTDSRVQSLCKSQISEYKALVHAEMEKKEQTNPHKRRKTAK
uniref:TFIIS N-terminal domain-containing protein n=1 Tax=Vannella robusta TaxID=1487602 RepID=A0A7S4M994_9EUKA|mmetsp:Transcript_15712/g.20006  ORF Transcript_15712/g.20006 Transcript_15712/m.20006 type:complete len:115 (+) Transcript_15712:23-367(+)|eukprot:CAMPEP_0206190964 /NCGR_PEP_ID=MMETSP0166-20121206/5063_1 /ASSEMBLY_ACC=CAM_ASM_000260 /TAXON_ID=95228 /ORGANISM="Vannella robusta, Strain DIVA3 518/3/11/1/6" /LENGTH=114 /DNA_ID=CAMNT_0053607143 /DNA_START=16 /DNA_END=360 /DNA_ORIENTATION=-